jgi:hypothetical protein
VLYNILFDDPYKVVDVSDHEFEIPHYYNGSYFDKYYSRLYFKGAVDNFSSG